MSFASACGGNQHGRVVGGGRGCDRCFAVGSCLTGGGRGGAGAGGVGSACCTGGGVGTCVGGDSGRRCGLDSDWGCVGACGGIVNLLAQLAVVVALFAVAVLVVLGRGWVVWVGGLGGSCGWVVWVGGVGR